MIKRPQKRLFVDMDGTIAEWRVLRVEVQTEEKIEGIQKDLYEILREPGYYYKLNPYRNVVNAIKQLYLEEDIEIYILSCVLPDCTAKEDKERWLDRYLPEIPKERRIFVPDGKAKHAYVPADENSIDFLLDDYTKNLRSWEKEGKHGIKLLNGINGNFGKWQGDSVSAIDSPVEIAKKIKTIIQKEKEYIKVQEEPEWEQ